MGDQVVSAPFFVTAPVVVKALAPLMFQALRARHLGESIAAC